MLTCKTCKYWDQAETGLSKRCLCGKLKQVESPFLVSSGGLGVKLIGKSEISGIIIYTDQNFRCPNHETELGITKDLVEELGGEIWNLVSRN